MAPIRIDRMAPSGRIDARRNGKPIRIPTIDLAEITQGASPTREP